MTSPIIGPRTEAQLEDAISVLDMDLDPDVSAKLDEIVPPGSAVSDFHNTSHWMKMRVAGTEPLESLEDMAGRL